MKLMIMFSLVVALVTANAQRPSDEELDRRVKEKMEGKKIPKKESYKPTDADPLNSGTPDQDAILPEKFPEPPADMAPVTPPVNPPVPKVEQPLTDKERRELEDLRRMKASIAKGVDLGANRVRTPVAVIPGTPAVVRTYVQVSLPSRLRRGMAGTATVPIQVPAGISHDELVRYAQAEQVKLRSLQRCVEDYPRQNAPQQAPPTTQHDFLYVPRLSTMR